MVSFYYYNQNPSGFSFLVQIIYLCYFNLAGITKFKCEWKNEENSGCSSKTIVQMAFYFRTLITGHLNNGGLNVHEYIFPQGS